MTMQHRNRYLAAARLFLDNPVSSARFVLDKLRGVAARHRLRFGDIALTIRTRAPDLTVVRACLLGEFEEAMAMTDPQARFIVDAGGYIGLVSILLAQRFPQAQIVCLEPSSENFALAQANCAPFANIAVLKTALGAHSGQSRLRDRGTGQWGFTIAPSADLRTIEIEQVEVIALSELMDRFGAERIDLLKLDIEGGEYELLEAAASWIGRCEVLIVELHEKIRPGIEALYERAVAGRREISCDAEKRLSVRTG